MEKLKSTLDNDPLIIQKDGELEFLFRRERNQYIEDNKACRKNTYTNFFSCALGVIKASTSSKAMQELFSPHQSSNNNDFKLSNQHKQNHKSEDTQSKRTTDLGIDMKIHGDIVNNLRYEEGNGERSRGGR